MMIAMCEPTPDRMTMTVEPAEMAELASSQLVRGEDARLVERLQPIVLHNDVSLDMGCVDRIDAAGISALLAVYQLAQDAGRAFSLSNVPPRVAQVLSLVGLESVLISHNAVRGSQYGSHRSRPAA